VKSQVASVPFGDFLVIEFASKNGKEEKDSSPPPEKGDYFARSHRECFAIVM
jgi:hypothetical protein